MSLSRIPAAASFSAMRRVLSALLLLLTVLTPRLAASVFSAPSVVPNEYIRGSDWGSSAGSEQAGGIGGILYSLPATGNATTARYYNYDGRGDVVAVTSNTGNVTYAAAYNAYGQHAVSLNVTTNVTITGTQEAGTDADLFRLTTKEEDAWGGVYDINRELDLGTNTWMQRDPAGMVNGPNPYTYVEQNPWTKTDPEGLQEAPPSEGGVEPVDPSETPAETAQNEEIARQIEQNSKDHPLPPSQDPVGDAFRDENERETGGTSISAPGAPPVKAPAEENQAGGKPGSNPILDVLFGKTPGGNSGPVAPKADPPKPPSESAQIPDDAIVVRGGSKNPGGGASPGGIQGGSGVTTDDEGNVHGVSVQAGTKPIEELAKPIQNKQIGVATAGQIRAVGGTVEPAPTPRNPDHALAGNIKPDILSDMLQPQKNPNQ